MTDDRAEGSTESECQVAQPHSVGSQRQPVASGRLTAEQLHRITFTESGEHQPGYDQASVDAFLDLVGESLRDPTRGLLTADRIRIPSFARPPIGRPGYDKGEVDAFLNLLAEQIAADRDRAAPKPVSRRPDRYVLYAMGSMTVAPMKPAITLEVGPDTVRLLDAERGVALAVAPLDEVTATPAHHGGIPVVVLDGAELPTLTIRPRHGAGAWQGRTKSRRPRYLVTDAEFTALIPTVGLASRLRDHAEPHGIWEHIAAFIEEWGGSVDITWRTPAMLGTLALITAAVVPASLPMSLIGGIVLLLFSAAAWRFDWRF